MLIKKLSMFILLTIMIKINVTADNPTSLSYNENLNFFQNNIWVCNPLKVRFFKHNVSF